ncbi:zinc finger, CCHC-type containing protein [Tanacetum coccineum]
MSMTIQSSVKDKILATPSETSKVENAPAEMLRDLDQQMEKRADDGCTLWIKLYSKYEYEIRYHPGKANVVIDALRRKERVKPRRVRAMAMTIQYGVRGMILAAQSEAFKQENGMMRTVVMDEAHASRYLVHPGADKTYYNLGDMYCLRYLSENEIESPWILSVNFQDNSKEWNSGDDQLRFRWMIYLVVLADAAESVSDAIRFEYCLASSNGWTKSPVLWAEIRESSLTGLELVQETTDKVVLIKEKLKVARNHQKSYVDYRRKPLEFEVGDQVILRVSPWKGVMRFGKKGKLTPRYVGPFEILERNWPYANLHVPLNKIKVDKTLRFVEEPVEIMDREIRKLKRRKVGLVKVRWNSKRGPMFTWEHEDQMRINYPQLLVMPLEIASRADSSKTLGFVTTYNLVSRQFLFDELRDRVVNDVVTQLKAKLLADVAFWKEAINDEIDFIVGNNTWGFRQKSGIDYFDTYAPVVRISTIRLMIAMASIHNLIIHLMDVKKTFLNGELEYEVYVNQPQGFIMPGNESKVCKLIKSLYGLKQAPKQCHQKFDEAVLSNCYLINQADTCVYSNFDKSSKGVIIFLYVDDMLIFGTDQVQVDMTKVIGCLMYAMTCTSPDIAFVVGKLSTYTSNPGTQHWQASKKQTCITGLTMEYEFVALAAAGKKAEWLRNLIFEIPLWSKPIAPISILCNSVATLAKAYSQMYNGKSRHLGVRHSMICELIMNGVCMTRSSSKELFSPLENPKQKFRSRMRLFDTPSLVESNSPKFDQISNIEEQSEKEVRETMTETMEQYMSKTRGDYGTFSGSEHEDANEHIKKVLEIVDLFHIPKITQDQIMLQAFPVALTGATSRWLKNQPSGSIITWEVLKTKFSNKYYPPARTAKKIEEINNFQQEPDESLFSCMGKI